jgi:hypothetical protein
MTLSKKLLSGFLIDPTTRTVEKKSFPADTLFKDVKKLGGYDLGDIRCLTSDVCLIVDDEGLLKPNHYWAFKGDPNPMAGKAFIIGTDPGGNFCSMRLAITVPQIFAMILWFEDDNDLETAIMAGLVDRPRSVMSDMGPDFNPIPGTEKVIWEWRGKPASGTAPETVSKPE